MFKKRKKQINKDELKKEYITLLEKSDEYESNRTKIEEFKINNAVSESLKELYHKHKKAKNISMLIELAELIIAEHNIKYYDAKRKEIESLLSVEETQKIKREYNKEKKETEMKLERKKEKTVETYKHKA